MSVAEMKQVVRRHYAEGWNEGRLDSVDETHVSNCVHHDPSNPEPFHGREEIKARLGQVRESFPDMHFELEDLIAEDDRVAVRWTASGTHRGPLAGMEATGRGVSFGGMIVHRFEDGRIAEDWVVRDSMSLMQQLGAFGG